MRLQRHGPISPDSHARAAVARAIRSGLLSRPEACEACGIRREAIARRGSRAVPPLVWHHHSYAPEHWTDVIALCLKCHKRVHTGLIPEPRTGRVRNDYPRVRRRRLRQPAKAAP